VAKPAPSAGGRSAFRRFPEWLPGNRALLFTSQDETGTFHLAVFDRQTGTERSLEQLGASPRWSPTGHIIYVSGTSLWALPFDPDRLRVTGSPTVVLDGVGLKVAGASSFSIARDNGSLAYASAAAADRFVAWIDAAGKITPMEGIPAGYYRDPRFSPDGGRL